MLSLTAKSKILGGTIPLPASKSESNRALIIQALNPAIELHNLASARDTQTMIKLLASEGQVLDVIDAGTTMRFLTAYCAVAGRDQLLTGTPRMCNRPIGGLVDALRSLGANIDYWKQEGFPPLHVVSGKGRMTGGKLNMPGNISSQFISAILLIAPYLSGGLDLTLVEGISSRPYLDMTMALMRHFGATVDWSSDSSIRCEEGPYQASAYAIESDWSGASYWYSLVALSDEAEITLKGLRENSKQGDRAIVEIMEHFGVQTTFTDEGAVLRKTKVSLPASLTIDCLETPDLAQTLAVVAGALGVHLTMTSLHTLRVKETDRITALENELSKFGLEITSSPDTITIGGTFRPVKASIHTYEDHRMAMAFAPLALKVPFLQLDDPEVVIKSYPEFWQHLSMIGIS
ncbi:MAG: 3-phosphoshikimate 1-carboxyvinyltransferase [Bacteroidia bacterium]|nr:3-phosphoshikimate 1-carboxyvinyltransferase [Bacteroidia bacterium]